MTISFPAKADRLCKICGGQWHSKRSKECPACVTDCPTCGKRYSLRYKRCPKCNRKENRKHPFLRGVKDLWDHLRIT